ncbi:sensor domain-containing diguanylate cyclase [Pengzhenrongella sicca]|uniref:Diguanylate cyclase n=1 Tax=Pengzhenrongella sicca TaxID=2819238 RepID=A0A8A4ZBD2_9MICO|nr:sensor domain-containing diguanylate cyclase [Pengzhenrongella sicca]QTE28721.1 diguanylate cyclase [Pengzhenrongella sicca]
MSQGPSRDGCSVLPAGAVPSGGSVQPAALAELAARTDRRGADAPAPAAAPLVEVLDLLTERISRYRVDDLVLVYCNKAWASAVGGDALELVGRTMDTVLTTIELDSLVRQVARMAPEAPLLTNNVELSGDRWIEWTDLYLPRPGGAEVLAVGRDVTDRREVEQRLAASEALYRDLALRDALTGLANRRLLDELLTSALARTRRDGQQLVVSYLDLDGFKEINDRHGHAVGDGVLEEVGQRLHRSIRGADAIARVGGDEFVVVQECPAGQVDRLAARLGRVLDDPITIGEVALQCRASTGSVCAGPGDDAASLVAAADAAMYLVKSAQAGRRRIQSRVTSA